MNISLLENKVRNINLQDLNNKIKRLFFGGHFYPYNVLLCSFLTTYNLCWFVRNNYSYISLCYGFFLSTFTWSFAEYINHRFLLHNFIYKYHKKHHTYPNRLYIIHIPMSISIIVMLAYYNFLNTFISEDIITNYGIFLPLYYLLFEYTHLISHSYKGSNYILQNAKLYHKLHHIDENVNYSFVTPFWDYMFGTISPGYNVSFLELLFGIIPFYSFIIRKKSAFSLYNDLKNE